MMADEGSCHFGFKRIRLRKDEPLGSGAYGAVCKAMCDQLLCAAKIMLPTLFDLSSSTEKASLLAKFQRECNLLSAIKHPNIVQYLGTWREPVTDNLVLLMELCDENLTTFLKRKKSSVSFQLQVNICHDVAVALSFLHNCGIIHRDMSSNNVLMIAGTRAKVTDFGMSKFEVLDARMTPTLCPGTMVYMSPEALEEPPQYSFKLDCFSWGVLAIQILTQVYPDPGPRFRTVADPNYPISIRLPVAEEERRKDHIELVDPSNPLLPLSSKCLSYEEVDRPSTSEICDTLLEIKHTRSYSEVESADADIVQATAISVNQKRQIDSHVDTSELLELKFELEQMSDRIETLKNALKNKEHDMKELAREMHTLTERNKILEVLIQQQKVTLESPAVTPTLIPKQVKKEEGKEEDAKEEEVKAEEEETKEEIVQEEVTPNESLNLTWRVSGRTPSEMLRGGVIVDGGKLYCHSYNKKVIQVYNLESEQWTSLPRCSYSHFGLAIIKGRITTVGGYNVTTTAELCTLVTSADQSYWSKVFPPMPTARCNSAVVAAEKYLVVAGGDATGSNYHLKIVELMDTETKQWTKVHKLPFPHRLLSAAYHKDKLYMAGGYAPVSSRAVYVCSISDLLHPSSSGKFRLFNKKSPWLEMSPLPVSLSTVVTIRGQLLAIGGEDSCRKPTAEVYQYDSLNSSWIELTHMQVHRNRSLVAAIDNDQLIVVGGLGGEASIEIASVQ